jgi:hypothetical protein
MYDPVPESNVVKTELVVHSMPQFRFAAEVTFAV